MTVVSKQILKDQWKPVHNRTETKLQLIGGQKTHNTNEKVYKLRASLKPIITLE